MGDGVFSPLRLKPATSRLQPASPRLQPEGLKTFKTPLFSGFGKRSIPMSSAKKALAVSAGFVFLLAFLSVCNKASGTYKADAATSIASGAYKAGTYMSSAEGYEGGVTVEVEFDHDSILSVSVVEENETKEIGGRAIETLPGEIVEAQTYAVDTFSGATITSNAIITAVKDCIDQATVKQHKDSE
jgi:fumarate reductase flavoprotein subunit